MEMVFKRLVRFMTVAFIFFSGGIGLPQTSFGETDGNHLPFEPGETLLYLLKWNGIVAGTIQAQVMPIDTSSGVKKFHFRMSGRTTPLVSYINDYQITADSFVDAGFGHSIFYQSSDADRKERETVKIYFDWKSNESRYNVEKIRKKLNNQVEIKKRKKTLSISPDTFDALAAAYQLRRSLLALGNQHTVPVAVTNGRKFLNGKAYVVPDEVLRLNGRSYHTKTLKVDIKTFGDILEVKDKKYIIDIWISNDAQMVPLKVRGKTKFGSVTAELEEMNGGPPVSLGAYIKE